MEKLFYFFILLNAGMELFFFLNEQNYEKHQLKGVISALYGYAPSRYDWDRELDYKRSHRRFALFTSLVNGLLMFLLFTTGIVPALSRRISLSTTNFFMEGLYFGIIAVTALFLFRIPFSWYVTFVIEARFGFNRKDVRTFLRDLFISFAIGLILTCLTLGMINWLISLPYGLPLIFLFIAFLGIVVSFLFPLVILPLFYRMDPVEEGPLKEELNQLVEKTGLKVRGIFLADESRRSGHANAMVSGLGSSKKIILFDTLFEKMDHGQILSVLAHELAHWGKGHTLKLTMAGLMEQALMIVILGFLWIWSKEAAIFGLEGTHLLRLLVIVYIASTIMNLMISPFQSWLSRKYEYQADEMAGTWTSPTSFCRALSDLATNDLSWIPSSPLYSLWFSSHPSIPERILRLCKKVPARGPGNNGNI